jgi:hypothetical protein
MSVQANHQRQYILKAFVTLVLMQQLIQMSLSGGGNGLATPQIEKDGENVINNIQM